MLSPVNRFYVMVYYWVILPFIIGAQVDNDESLCNEEYCIFVERFDVALVQLGILAEYGILWLGSDEENTTTVCKKLRVNNAL